MSLIRDEIYFMNIQAAIGEDLSEEEIERFNCYLDVLLKSYHITLDRYHELLLEEMEQIVEDDDCGSTGHNTGSNT